MNGGNTAVASVTMTHEGSGYTVPPTVTFSGGTETVNATGTAVMEVAVVNPVPGVQYMYAPTVSFSGGGGSGATAASGIDGFGHASFSLTNAGTGYTTVPTVTITPNALDMEYSAWRYSPTTVTASGTGAWDRINSWSLYSGTTDLGTGLIGGTFNPVAFSMIATTPAKDAVFISNNNTNMLYRSLDQGQTWMQWGQQVPTTNGTINCWLVINPSTVLIGITPNGPTTGGTIYTTTNGAVWMQRQAFANTTVTVTSIALAPNGDYLAAGVDSLTDINIASSSNAGVTWSGKDEGSTVRASAAITGKAYIMPAADYSTSKIVYFCGDGTNPVNNGIWFSTISGTANRADNSATWVQQGANPTTGLITAAGGPGFTAEGTGMAYATTSAGVIRVKGRVATSGVTAAAELIPNPTGATLTGLYASTTAVGNTTLYALGATNNNIYYYTDTLNGAVSGVAVPAATISTSFATGLSSATVQWTVVPNATAYLVFVDSAQLWTNIYDAIYGNFTGVAGVVLQPTGTATTASVTFTNLLAPATTYNVSVWAIKYSGTTALSAANTASTALNLAWTTDIGLLKGSTGSLILSTFGGTGTFTTPLQVPLTPTNLVPALGSTISPVNPNFDWMTVVGATSYTLQITTATDPGFATPLYTNSAVPIVSGPTASFTYIGTLANNSSYIWRVEANGSLTSTWVYGNFYTTLAVVPPVTVTQAATPPTPTIIITMPPSVTITQAAPVPTPTLVVTQPVYTLVQPTSTTPTYIWVIVAVGAVLTLAVIVLIIRTRRVV
jgi:hypothetical protein